jgi:hypothetical protein
MTSLAHTAKHLVVSVLVISNQVVVVVCGNEQENIYFIAITSFARYVKAKECLHQLSCMALTMGYVIISFPCLKAAMTK